MWCLGTSASLIMLTLMSHNFTLSTIYEPFSTRTSPLGDPFGQLWRALERTRRQPDLGASPPPYCTDHLFNSPVGRSPAQLRRVAGVVTVRRRNDEVPNHQSLFTRKIFRGTGGGARTGTDGHGRTRPTQPTDTTYVCVCVSAPEPEAVPASVDGYTARPKRR